MLPDQYVWLFWAGTLSVFWLALFTTLPAHRGIMLVSSLVGSLLGVSQPYFVPAYWRPPSLGDLALSTGFDLESLLFCFAITGLSVGLLNKAWQGQVTLPTTIPARRQLINRIYLPLLAAPFIFFPVAYPYWPYNPIYLAIMTLAIGGLGSHACFLETWRRNFRALCWFLAICAVPLLLIKGLTDDYITRVWQLDELSGIFLAGIPVEEFLFAISFCLCCNGVYMLLLWHRYGRQPVNGQS
ncbi:MAG: lycopene cyclase domain-containing protein [Oceanococcus sp.]